MTEEQEKKCHAIIHTCAVAAGGANAAPLPGLGVAADLVALTTMTMSLATVFGGNIPKEVAKGIAINQLRRQVLNKPIQALTKELTKLIPGLGQVVAPTISIALIEAAGWAIAKQLEMETKNT